MDVKLHLIIIANHLGPCSRLFSDNELAALEVKSHTGNGVRKDDALQIFKSTSAAPEVGGLASRNGENRQSSTNVSLGSVLGR